MRSRRTELREGEQGVSQRHPPSACVRSASSSLFSLPFVPLRSDSPPHLVGTCSAPPGCIPPRGCPWLVTGLPPAGAFPAWPSPAVSRGEPSRVEPCVLEVWGRSRVGESLPLFLSPSSSGRRLCRRFRLRPQIRRGDPLNLSILLSGGKETNQDSLSNGE